MVQKSMDTNSQIDRRGKRNTLCFSRSHLFHRGSTRVDLRRRRRRVRRNVQRQSVHVSSGSDTVLHRESWFGCSGKCAGFTPYSVGSIIQNESFRHGVVDGILSHYKKRFEYINAQRACEILKAFGCGDDVYSWIGPDNERHLWSPNSVTFTGGIINFKNWYAKSVSPIEFLGGPPSKWGIHCGTLLTLLLDRLAVSVLLEGFGALDGIISPDENYSKYA